MPLMYRILNEQLDKTTIIIYCVALDAFIQTPFRQLQSRVGFLPWCVWLNSITAMLPEQNIFQTITEAIKEKAVVSSMLCQTMEGIF